MEAKPYNELSDIEIVALAIWREARGEPYEGQRAVGWCIKNRVCKPGWWGHDWHSVVLKPFQFSSFNKNDPNEKVWPSEMDTAWSQCFSIAGNIVGGADTQDLTDGASSYYDRSIEFPASWGLESEWENTLNIHRLRFWKRKE